MSYKNLTEKEICLLEQQNCKSIDGWDNILVSDGFQPSFINNVTFSGEIKLGKLGSKLQLPSLAYDYSGIYNAHLHNCAIGNDCYIKNVGSAISNYVIEDNVIIQNIGFLSTTEESTFGNGIEVCPLNEAGGRDVLIYNELSSHIAYMQVFYRHKPKLIDALKKDILKYVDALKSDFGKIGRNATITNCANLTNINVGEYAVLDNAEYLNNATVNSTKDAPTQIANGVNASDFIVSDGSVISDGATLRNCFVGQGCEIGNSYTAENSLFFANSQCLQGEACSIFAGPYTVTHHKSTLLIAGYYSFFNAGSGTNQSNHMYKLGPVHQGVIERGGKTGSDSYVLWPAQLGAFSMILGRHYSNPDISLLPFSYLIEDGGKSVLMPGQNIFNVGITRDVEKWPNRDKRKGNDHLDHLITEALNPYTVNKIVKGVEELKRLQAKASPQGKNLMYKNTQIALTSIKRGIKLYEQALVKYVGDELVNALKQPNFDRTKIIDPTGNDWVDLCGLICRYDSIKQFMQNVEKRNINLDEWNLFFKNTKNDYDSLKQEHAFEILKSQFNIEIASCSDRDIIAFIEQWKDNNTKIKSAILMDAKKEFNPKSKISFGIDGDEECRDEDFQEVRGDVSGNSFIKGLQTEHEAKEQLANDIIDKLNK